jgi:hypothetical protein
MEGLPRGDVEQGGWIAEALTTESLDVDGINIPSR